MTRAFKKLMFSVIIPVYHESENINFIIKNIKKIDSSYSYEIIVVDGSNDLDTIKVIKYNKVVSIVSKKGRFRQMNTGAKIASGEILIFLHSDTELPNNSFTEIKKLIDTEEFVAGAFRISIRSDKTVYKIISKLINFRTMVTRIPYGDQCIFIKKDYFKKIGGYRNIAIMEDVELMRRIKRSGNKICILPNYVKTSSRRWEKEGIIFCTLRNWMIRFFYYIGIHPDKLEKFYR